MITHRVCERASFGHGLMTVVITLLSQYPIMGRGTGMNLI